MKASLPTYFPSHAENRMRHEGDLVGSRKRFIERRTANLDHLLRSRYEWMNEFSADASTIYELGCGAGFSRFYLRNPKLKLTDAAPNAWVDLVVDAQNMPFADSSVDVLVASHMIHHIASPADFFAEVRRVLRPGGRLLISEIYTSWLMRFVLGLMKHEGWSYEVDVFHSKTCNDPRDLWSANCAIPEMLFRDPDRFERETGLRLAKFERCECLTFLNSGGVNAKTFLIPLPRVLLKAVSAADRWLVRLAPRAFALGLKAVVEKPSLSTEGDAGGLGLARSGTFL